MGILIQRGFITVDWRCPNPECNQHNSFEVRERLHGKQAFTAVCLHCQQWVRVQV